MAELGAKTQIAETVLAGGGVVSVQILNEFASVMRSKFKQNIGRVRLLIDEVLIDCPDPRPLTLETHRTGLLLSERYGFSIYDGTMIASALEARQEESECVH